jgi:hypothetical protein
MPDIKKLQNDELNEIKYDLLMPPFPIKYKDLYLLLIEMKNGNQVDISVAIDLIGNSLFSLEADLINFNLYEKSGMATFLNNLCLQVLNKTQQELNDNADSSKKQFYKVLSKFYKINRFYELYSMYLAHPSLQHRNVPTFDYNIEYIKKFVNEKLFGNDKVVYLSSIINLSNRNGLDEVFIDKLVKFKKFTAEEVLPKEESKTSDDKSNENDGTFSLHQICKYNPNSKKINWFGYLKDIVRFARLIEIKKYNRISSIKELGNFVIKHFEWEDEELDLERIKKQIGEYYTKSKNEIVFKSKIIKGHEDYILNELLQFLE